jgi:DNA-directed RNA polymerase subunit RPC12/RpoP
MKKHQPAKYEVYGSETACKKCGCVGLWWSKWLYGRPEAPLYHYKVRCEGCNSRRLVKRTQIGYSLTVQTFWNRSKKFEALEKKQEKDLSVY